MIKNIMIGILCILAGLALAVLFNFAAFISDYYIGTGTSGYFVAGILFYAIFTFRKMK